jgi:hypothetical protein
MIDGNITVIAGSTSRSVRRQHPVDLLTGTLDFKNKNAKLPKPLIFYDRKKPSIVPQGPTATGTITTLTESPEGEHASYPSPPRGSNWLL